MRRRDFCTALVLYSLFPQVMGLPALPSAQAAESGQLTRRHLLVQGVREALGKPYVWGAEGPDAFDCSGLVRWLYARAGVRLPRTARQQGSQGRRAGPVLRFGDVLLFRSRRSPSGWHCGMYLARNVFVHAAGRDRGVILSPLAGHGKRLVAARRYLA